MNSIALMRTGIANISIGMATLDGIEMPMVKFLADTGATRTTIPKKVLVDELGYTDEYIQNNKVLLSDADKPTMANGSKADVYKVKAPRINIGVTNCNRIIFLHQTPYLHLTYCWGLIYCVFLGLPMISMQ